jgi:vanillate O-demethylase ferredoxin subunit
VLGVRPRYGDFFGWLEGFHKFLQLEPTVGEPITGSISLVFAGVILTGIFLWWPATRRALKAGLTINSKLSGRPWNLSLHKTVGIYAAVVVFASALTGVPIAFDWAKNGLYPLTASQKESPPRQDRAAGKPFAGFTAVGQKLAALWPSAHETYVPLPKKGVLTTYVIAADAPHPSARSYAWFDPADATLLRATPYAAASRGFRLYYWMMSFHTALIGGWAMQVLLFLGALSLPLLAYTGTASFLQRKFRQQAPALAKVPGQLNHPPAGA